MQATVSREYSMSGVVPPGLMWSCFSASSSILAPPRTWQAVPWQTITRRRPIGVNRNWA